MCVVYYYTWLIWLPRLVGYIIVEEIEELDDGARVTRLTRRYAQAKSLERQPLLGAGLTMPCDS